MMASEKGIRHLTRIKSRLESFQFLLSRVIYCPVVGSGYRKATLSCDLWELGKHNVYYYSAIRTRCELIYI